VVIRTDEERRKRSAYRGAEAFGAGGYAPEVRDQVYSSCLAQAEQVVSRGGRAIVDASFARERWRHALLDLGLELGVPAQLVWCTCAPEGVKARLAERRGDASDADWSIHVAAAAAWEAESERVERSLQRVDTHTADAIARVAIC
jgi:hypothetical protein